MSASTLVEKLIDKINSKVSYIERIKNKDIEKAAMPKSKPDVVNKDIMDMVDFRNYEKEKGELHPEDPRAGDNMDTGPSPPQPPSAPPQRHDSQPPIAVAANAAALFQSFPVTNPGQLLG